MSTATYCPNCPSVSKFKDFGFGPDVEGLKKYYDKVVEEFKSTETFRRPMEDIYDSLLEVYEECSVENWDGYDALPVSEDMISEAVRLIELLPSSMNFPMPNITAEPNGEIALEWYRESRRIFVVSVTGHNELIYAGLFGASKTHGIEHFGNSLPAVIISNLKRLYS